MKKKLALIVISLDECFSQKGFSGGGHKVTKNLILELIASGLFDIDIFCKNGIVGGVNGDICEISGINSITVLNNKKTFIRDLKEKVIDKGYNYILASDVLIPFANNVIHSNSSKFKSKNGKNKFLQLILKIYNAKKIKTQEQNLPKDKAIFTVSESLKNDFVSNYDLDEKRVFVSYPAVDDYAEFVPAPIKSEFTIGSMAGGGLNKGGYLLLSALWRLPKTCRLKAKIIFPKIKKAFFFKTMIKLLRLENRIDLLPKQENMSEYYKTIDCYVLPSLNEAFGLVVTEAASNFKPSLVSSTTGVSELVEDGNNGFIFNREKTPVRNLIQKLIEITDMYFNENEKFVNISKNAHEISTKLDWKKFADTIINNMVEEV